MVRTNPPLELDHTSGPKEWWCLRESQTEKIIKRWDEEYRGRAREYGNFLACSPVWIDLERPIYIDDQTMRGIMDRIPGTQNPPKISGEQLDSFLKLTKRKIA